MRSRWLATAAPSVAMGVVLGLSVSCSSGSSNEPPAPAPVPTSANPLPALTPATTPVPPPKPGKITSTVPSRKTGRRPAVPLNGKGKPEKGVEVTLTSVRAVQAEARGPGEVAGPALAVTVQLANTTGAAVGTANTVVTLTGSGGRPGLAMSGPPSAPLPAAVGRGSTASGVYLFTVPVGRRDPITVQVAVSADAPVVLFRGPAG